MSVVVFGCGGGGGRNPSVACHEPTDEQIHRGTCTQTTATVTTRVLWRNSDVRRPGVRPPTADAPNTTRSVTLTFSVCCWSAIMLLALKRERETNGKSAEHNERIPATSNGEAGKKTLLGGWVTDKPSTARATVRARAERR